MQAPPVSCPYHRLSSALHTLSDQVSRLVRALLSSFAGLSLGTSAYHFASAFWTRSSAEFGHGCVALVHSVRHYCNHLKLQLQSAELLALRKENAQLRQELTHAQETLQQLNLTGPPSLIEYAQTLAQETRTGLADLSLTYGSSPIFQRLLAGLHLLSTSAASPPPPKPPIQNIPGADPDVLAALTGRSHG